MYLNPEKREYYMGRVIGLPGESIQVSGRRVYINNRVLDEQRIMVQPQRNDYGPLTELSTEGTGPYTVYYTKRPVDDFGDSGDFGVDAPFAIPADNYFILGDNRDNSYDSRYRGAIMGNLIWGKASIIYYSEKMPQRDGVRTERILKKVR